MKDNKEAYDKSRLWKEAVKEAYSKGHANYGRSLADFAKKARKDKRDYSLKAGRDRLANDQAFQATIHEGFDYRRFWRWVEDYYKCHFPGSYDRLMKEAAVAEDLVIAYEAGAIDGILEVNDPDRISHLW